MATILARRVAVEFSDSDDGPSDSEYDSDDWGKDPKYSPLICLLFLLFLPSSYFSVRFELKYCSPGETDA